MKYESYRKYTNFIDRYKAASNAASGSEFDANANVENKNIATMSGELFKSESIGTNRLLMVEKITQMYGEELADEYIRQLDEHEIYKHDETSIYPYCVSISMYPFLFNGLKTIGGISSPPKNLNAFVGSFINLVFAIAAQFAGAVSTPEFLTYLDYFIRKEYGDDYYKNPNISTTQSPAKPKSLMKTITDIFEQVVYSMNQPAAARNFQSVFWNIAYFDKNYFEGIFENFVFPDGDTPRWESVSWLQKAFMNWFNQERRRSILTFPVETVNLLDDGKEYVDKEWADFTAQMYAAGHSFFTYRSNSVDSLASCCRLRNNIQNNTFSYTLGAGGVSTGSKGVMTINLNRLVQNAVLTDTPLEDAVREQVQKIHKYLTAFNEIMYDNFNAKLLPIYDAGYISLDKQYLTVGINGFVEGAEYLGIDISPNEDYFKYGETILKPIFEENASAKTDKIMFNTEFVPKMSGYVAA